MLKLELENKNEKATQRVVTPWVKKQKKHECFYRPYPPIANTVLGDKLKEFLKKDE